MEEWNQILPTTWFGMTAGHLWLSQKEPLLHLLMIYLHNLTRWKISIKFIKVQ